MRASYVKSFKQDKDSYDPHSDSYLLTELTYQSIYNLREILSSSLDCAKKIIYSDTDILLMSRKKPTSIAEFDKCLVQMSMNNSTNYLPSLGEVIVYEVN